MKADRSRGRDQRRWKILERECYDFISQLPSIRFVTGARSPSGKAKVCKTFIGGSIPPRASKMPLPCDPLAVERLCLVGR